MVTGGTGKKILMLVDCELFMNGKFNVRYSVDRVVLLNCHDEHKKEA